MIQNTAVQSGLARIRSTNRREKVLNTARRFLIFYFIFEDRAVHALRMC